ncbi:nucleoporin 50, partial [Homo sapiens]
MAKRNAEKELTDRNWDQEDEAEEVGTFSMASEEVLKNRAIKKAKRRNVGFEVLLLQMALPPWLIKFQIPKLMGTVS